MTGAMLTTEALKPVVDQAIAYWTNQSPVISDPAELSRIQIHVADLSGSALGIASSSNRIWIDRDAAGYGWNIASTSGGMDLLSAVTHEFGHKLGLQHDHPDSVMAASLIPTGAPLGMSALEDINLSLTSAPVREPDAIGFDVDLAFTGIHDTHSFEALNAVMGDSLNRHSRDQYFELLTDAAAPVITPKALAAHIESKGEEPDTSGALAQILARLGSEENAIEQILYEEALLAELSMTR